MPKVGVLDDCGVLGVVVVTDLGELDNPPSRCCGGTVTVMGAVTTGAEAGMGSDTEITMLLGAVLVEDTGAGGCLCCVMTTC